jgi:hypothetical protein
MSSFLLLSIERNTFGGLDASFGVLEAGTLRTAGMAWIAEIAEIAWIAEVAGIAGIAGAAGAAGAATGTATGTAVWTRCDLVRSAAVLLCLQRSRRMCESWVWEAEAMTDLRSRSSACFSSSFTLASASASASVSFIRRCRFGGRWFCSCCCLGFLFWLEGGGDSWTVERSVDVWSVR